MKKALSVLLVVLMLVTLFSCGGNIGSSGTSTPPAASNPSSSSSPVSTTSLSPSSSEAASELAAVDLTTKANEIGFFDDGVDPHSRKTYNLYFSYPYSIALFQNMYECMQHFSSKLNFTINTTSGEGDIDKTITNIQTLADGGDVDGWLACVDPAASGRFNEVLTETGKPYITLLNSVRDDSGGEIAPCVGLSDVKIGGETLQWLYDNYKTYWGEIEPTEIALINITASTSLELNNRAIGSENKFKELLPDNKQIFTLDMIGDYSSDGAYNQAAATFSANPEIKYWFVTNVLEQYSQGVARAAESLGFDNKVLAINIGSDILTAEWDSNYDGGWKACLAVSEYNYVAPALCGLIALIDGKTTPENLWTVKKGPLDKCAFYDAPGLIVTKDTYKDYFNKIAAIAEAPLPYPDEN